MFVNSPFWLGLVVSGVIAAVLMLALWLGLDRGLARRMVLAAIIPAVAVAVLSAIGLPDTLRGGAGAALLMLVLGGLAGVVMDFLRLRGRVCAVVMAVLLLLGGWLVLAAPSGGLMAASGLARLLAWAVYLVAGLCFFAVTRPDFTQDDADNARKPAARGKKGTKSKTASRAKPANGAGDGAGDMSFGADMIGGLAHAPAAMMVFLAMAIGQGIVAAQFGLSELAVLNGALAIAVGVALVSEKAVPQYRTAPWLAVCACLLAAGAGAVMAVPAAGFAVSVLILLIFAPAAGGRIAGHLPLPDGGAAVLLGAAIRLAALAMPVLIAALLGYIGSTMQAGL